MNQKLRLRILKKLAQAPTPAATQATTAAPPAVPGVLFATIANGYNSDTIAPITKLSQILNGALHYASDGKGNLQKVKDNALDLSGAGFDYKNVGIISKKFYSTFLNNGNPFTVPKTAEDINEWANAIQGSSEYNDLTKISPTSNLAQKINSVAGTGNLKEAIRAQLDLIRSKNPLNP